MAVFRLQDLLKQDKKAIAATSTLMGMGIAKLDCQEVESLSNEQLEALFSAIPQDWDFDKFGDIIDPDTVSESLAQQLSIGSIAVWEEKNTKQASTLKRKKPKPKAIR
ncbi:MAG: hypothetical protein IGR93_07160 [Hydrococcus sp. C42_A2020_068]|uniref:hypothetical protein n=1 Tax=Pleurocapsa sp. PCC 7327 TaxID=118163 RepID=UPI000688BB29|nr:hypothetical protein [Pleurocapsa sp. PCC 7327]MBF2019871.1 hypothetical protein [Hydrococcus sp. C42_A2020_068]